MGGMKLWVGIGRLWTTGEANIPVGRKCRQTATGGLRVLRGHCERLRLYWYNRKYNINLVHITAARW